MRKVIGALLVWLGFAGAAVAAPCASSNSWQIQSSGTSVPIASHDDGTSTGICESRQDLDQLGGVSLGGATTWGTAPTGEAVFGANVDVLNTPTVLQGGAPWSVSQSGTWTVQPGNTPNTSPWLVTQVPATNSGYTSYFLSGGSLASTNSNSIKTSAGLVHSITVVNGTTTVAFLRMYNTASAPTCSSSNGVVHDYLIGAASAVNVANGLAITPDENYSTGIGFCLTGALGNSDTTNAPVGITVDVSFK